MAELTWACPECAGADEPKAREGTCPRHLIPLELGVPEPGCRLAMDTPWRRIELPDGVDVIVGRHTMTGPAAARFDHVGRRHLLVTATPTADLATIVDLQSTNGSYVDGTALAALREHPLRVGETVRLGKDEGPERTALCVLVRICDPDRTGGEPA